MGGGLSPQTHVPGSAPEQEKLTDTSKDYYFFIVNVRGLSPTTNIIPVAEREPTTNIIPVAEQESFPRRGQGGWLVWFH